MPIKQTKELVDAANAAVEVTSVDQAEALVGRPDVQFVDVRETSEWDKGHVPGAVHVPRGLLEFQADPSTPSFKPELEGKKLVVYCAAGGRSALAAKTLKDMGYDGVVNMQGGFTAWSQAGKKVEG